MATDAIVQKIARDFRANVNSNTAIRPLQKKLLKGKATYDDADRYAIETAKALGKALSDNLVDDALSTAEYRVVIAEVLPAGLNATYDTVKEYAQVVQRGLNERAKITLKAVVPAVDSEAIVATTAKAVRATAYSEISGAVNQDAMAFAQNVAVRSMVDNATFQNNVGYTVTVERIYDEVGVHNRKDACEWCLEKEGTWEYQDALEQGVFARHPGCGCTIIYHAEKGPQLQTEWEHNVWENL